MEKPLKSFSHNYAHSRCWLQGPHQISNNRSTWKVNTFPNYSSDRLQIHLGNRWFYQWPLPDTWLRVELMAISVCCTLVEWQRCVQEKLDRKITVSKDTMHFWCHPGRKQAKMKSKKSFPLAPESGKISPIIVLVPCKGMVKMSPSRTKIKQGTRYPQVSNTQ